MRDMRPKQISSASGTENNKTRTNTSIVIPVLLSMAGMSLFKLKSEMYSVMDSIIKSLYIKQNRNHPLPHGIE